MPTGKFKIDDIDKKAGQFVNTTPPASWSQYSGDRPVDYGAIEANAKKPSLLTDPQAWWGALDDDGKQQVLDTLGELAGGTVGALAGGGTVASIIGAGAGSVAGRNLISRPLGKAMGLNETSLSDLVTGNTKPKRTATDELKDTALTFASGAAGEGVFRALPLVKRGVQELAKRATRKLIKPEPRAIQLAQQAGVDLTPGMATDNKAWQTAENLLEQTPGGTQTIRNKRIEAVEKLEGKAKKIGDKFHPSPVRDDVAGLAQQEALDANRSAASAHYGQRYEKLNAAAGDAPIDFTLARDQAQQFLTNLPQGMEGYFPGGTIRKLQMLADAPDGQRIAGGMIDGSNPVMTFKEAQQLRTALLEAERGMKTGDAAVQRRMIPALRQSIDASIDDSLANSNNPAYQAALPEWRRINSEFGETSSKLYPHGKKANPTTKIIESAKRPEDIPGRIASSPTAIRESETAVTPMFGSQSGDAMNQLRRNRVDNLLEDSRTTEKLLEDKKHLNPRRLENALDDNRDAHTALLGPGATQELRDTADLGKAITGPMQIANRSETARYNNLFRYGSMLAGGAYGAASGEEGAASRIGGAVTGAALGAYGLPKLAAKAWTGPVARAVIAKPKPLISGPAGGPLLGAAGRSIMAMQQIPSPQPIERKPMGRFTAADIQ